MRRQCVGTLAGALLLRFSVKNTACLALDNAVWATLHMVVDNEEIAVLAVGYPEWLARFPRRGLIALCATPAAVVAALRMSEGPACQVNLFLKGGTLNMLQEMLQRDPNVKQVDGRVTVLFGNVYGVSQNVLNWWFIAAPARHFQEGGKLLSKRRFSFGPCLFLVNSPDDIQDEPIMDDIEICVWVYSLRMLSMHP